MAHVAANHFSGGPNPGLSSFMLNSCKFCIQLMCAGGFNFMLSVTGSPNDALYKELWHACAGPLVTVPREGERVYYFPQGHMEQVFWFS